MKKVSQIGSLLKRIYRLYNNELLRLLQLKGFTDLRPSFLEILLYICENDGPSIKSIGRACGLKKQTMTSHLNELERRGYIERKVNPSDKREQNIFLTEYGERFKFNLFESISEVERVYVDQVGKVELDRVEHLLSNFHTKINQEQKDTLQSRVQLNLNLDF
ncbi:MarR family winged helix-turn-helix transcriptional regulator [Halobacteriovorax sp. GB3]|uniref:MarR family winged helix-turn-helix transcriptional regulator n=1 Tax=Halobacteriovorax sp. GB3 TaxID=2719615 RepID=UPI002362B6C3|nr:MarR family winged helix-turn-helix transcriptional regulator [Halobacteriovorax sp. GB3]MDD0852665.1 MarR family winged helix-turn-helix transcriptional regulator [Halobacteriovorax sp. GB3]